MAKYIRGILGPVSGGVGTVVGSSWKGITYLKSKPVRSRTGSSLKQDVQRLKFKTVIEFHCRLDVL